MEGKEVELTHANAAKFLAARDGETRINAFESSKSILNSSSSRFASFSSKGASAAVTSAFFFSTVRFNSMSKLQDAEKKYQISPIRIN